MQTRGFLDEKERAAPVKRRKEAFTFPFFIMITPSSSPYSTALAKHYQLELHCVELGKDE